MKVGRHDYVMDVSQHAIYFFSFIHSFIHSFIVVNITKHSESKINMK